MGEERRTLDSWLQPSNRSRREDRRRSKRVALNPPPPLDLGLSDLPEDPQTDNFVPSSAKASSDPVGSSSPNAYDLYHKTGDGQSEHMFEELSLDEELGKK